EKIMSVRPTAFAFDVGPDSLASLRQAFPTREISAFDQTTAQSLRRQRDLEAVALLIVGIHDQQIVQTLALCRILRAQEGRAQTPLLVLVPPARQALVRAAPDAGTDSCLVLPIHTKDVVDRVARARDGNRPGRHTLGLDRGQALDEWQDDGGEA